MPVEIQKVNDVFVRVVADPHVKMEMSDYFTFSVPGAQFMPAVQNKIWDGKIRLLNVMTGLIYAGLVPYIGKFCLDREYEYTLDESLLSRDDIPDDFGYTLAKEFDSAFEPRDYQNDAVVKALRNRRRLLLSPTASGKSFIIYLIARFLAEQGKKVLIIVPTTSLVSQMASDFVEYNKDRPLNIHKIVGGVDKEVYADYTISTWQSIYKMPKTYFDSFDCVIGDEAHLFKAKSLTSIMEKMPNCEYRYGLTGTLDGTLTNKLVLEGLFGQVLEVTKTKKLIADKTLAEFDIKAVVLQYPDYVRKSNKGKTYQEEIDWIVSNEARNTYIRNLATKLEGNVLILFQYVEKHGKVLQPMLQDRGKEVHFVHGGISGDEREHIRQYVENSTNNIILASYGTFSTGVNIKKLDHIIFASPSKSKIRNLQSIGRVLRKGNGKTKSSLYDIVDDMQWKQKKNFAVLHFLERVKIYNSEGFELKIYNVELKG